MHDVESVRAAKTILDPAVHPFDPTAADLKTNDLFAPVHVSAWRHLGLVIYDRPQGEVLALDPLGVNGRGDEPSSLLRQTCDRLVVCLQHALQEYSVPGLRYVAFDAFKFVNVFRRKKRAARQADGISCGVSVFAYIYWFSSTTASSPTVTDFPGVGNHVTARLGFYGK